MSYCRFSSDNWHSDVYVYEDEVGWRTHVATRRYVGDIPREPDWGLLADPGKHEQWMREHNAVMKFLDTAGHEDIKLPYAGESFSDPTAETCRDRLLLLRSLGYHVPQDALDVLAEEIEEEKKNKRGDEERSKT